MSTQQVNCDFHPLDGTRIKCRNCSRVVKSQNVETQARCRAATPKQPQDKTPADLPCSHRGELLRVTRCEACGFRDTPLEIYACDKHTECTIHNRGARIGDIATAGKCKACVTCQDRTALASLPPIENVIKDRQRLGKPWIDNKVTVTFAHLDTPEILDLAVRSWLAQDDPPFLLVVDTGSVKPESHELLARLANMPGIEVARLGISHQVEHLSDRVSISIDYALSRCPTDHLLLTHVDVFPLRADLADWLAGQCDEARPVVGWEMSERVSRDGQDLSSGMPGHACLMLHVPTMDRLGAGWSMRRGHNAFGLPRGKTDTNGWPDTETCFAEILRDAGVEPVYLGRETNGENQDTGHWIHLRSATLATLQGGLLPRHVAGLAKIREKLTK